MPGQVIGTRTAARFTNPQSVLEIVVRQGRVKLDSRAWLTRSRCLAFMFSCQVPSRGRLGGGLGPGLADRAARGLSGREPGVPGSASGAREMGPRGGPGCRTDPVRPTGARALPLRHDALRAPRPSPALP